MKLGDIFIKSCFVIYVSSNRTYTICDGFNNGVIWFENNHRWNKWFNI